MSAIEKYNKLINANNEDNELFESYEDSETYDYEDLENLNDDIETQEDLENFRLRRKLLKQRAQSPSLSKKVKIQSGLGMPLIKRATPKLQQTGLTPTPDSVVTQFDLKITRYDDIGDSTITEPLPIIAFLPVALVGNYKGLVTPPLGITLANVQVNNGAVVFYYIKGDLKTNIIIECLQVPYTDLLFGLLNAEFDIFKMRFLTPKTNYEAYLSQPLGTIARTMFGRISNIDTIPFTSQKSPSDYAPNIIDVDLNLHIQSDKGLTYVMPRVNPPDNSITISFFVNNLIKK